MPEADNNKDAKNYYLDVPVRNELFFLKGSNSYDWGMKNRLARIFNPVSGKAVMLAFDHGYFQGPTTGLERVDVTILPLAEYADALMLTRGILRTTIPASTQKPFVMRASGGPSILKELSNEQIAVDTEDALRMNASAVAVQVFIGGEFETQSVHNMTRLVDAGDALRPSDVGRHRRREGYRAGCPIYRAGITNPGRVGRHLRKNLLCPWFRDGHRVLPGPDRDRRRQETA